MKFVTMFNHSITNYITSLWSPWNSRFYYKNLSIFRVVTYVRNNSHLLGGFLNIIWEMNWFLDLAENKDGSGLKVEYYIDNDLDFNYKIKSSLTSLCDCDLEKESSDVR